QQHLSRQNLSPSYRRISEDERSALVRVARLPPPRGLSTKLRELGIPHDVIQRILHLADIGTTQEHYAKTLPKAVRKAISKLDRSLTRDKPGTARRHTS
ncbi:MAG: hypothetical protein WCC71_25740, partial [Candidatus Sulfotelmatobacter sp.]